MKRVCRKRKNAKNKFYIGLIVLLVGLLSQPTPLSQFKEDREGVEKSYIQTREAAPYYEAVDFSGGNIGGGASYGIPTSVTVVDEVSLQNKGLVECLVWWESRGNNEAKGLDGEIGVLQFLPETFEDFCVKHYALENEIKNESIQKECADKMITDGYVYLWTTSWHCL